jgi:hypothetical protein
MEVILMWRKIGLISLTLLVAAMALGAIGVAHASSEGAIEGVLGLRGQIVAVTGASLTVQVGAREVTVLLNEDTRYRVIGDDDPGLADLVAGDQVLVRGGRSEEKTLIAWWVGKIPPGQPRRGRLVAVENDSIVLATDRERRVPIAVTSVTIVARGSDDYLWAEGGQEQLRVGMPLFVFGETGEDAPPTAATIVVVPRGRLPAARNVRGGSIVSLGEGSLMLETPRRGTITVVTDESTRYRAPGTPSASLADFEVGDAVVVLGKAMNEDLYLARLITPRPPGRPIAGTIDTIDDDVIVLTARSGETWTVLTDEGTRFHAGRCPIALDSFAPGDRVVALGDVQAENNTLLALHVARRAFRPACRLQPFAQTTAT